MTAYNNVQCTYDLCPPRKRYLAEYWSWQLAYHVPHLGQVHIALDIIYTCIYTLQHSCLTTMLTEWWEEDDFPLLVLLFKIGDKNIR